MCVYYDCDCDVNLIKDKKVVMLGYGSQGYVYVLNLCDLGVKNLVVVLCEGLVLVKKVEVEGLKVMGIVEVVVWVDLIMFIMFDEL